MKITHSLFDSTSNLYRCFNSSIEDPSSLSLSGLIRARRFHPRKLCGLLFFRGVFEAVQLLLFQSRAYLITHLRDRHCSGEVQAITKNSLLTDLVVFERAELILYRPPILGIRFVIYDLTKPLAPSCSQLDHVDGLLLDQHDGFTLSLLDSLLSKGLRTVKSIPLKCRLGFSRVLKGALDKVICKPDDVSCWVSLLVLPLCLLKTFCPRSNLECKSANKRQRQEESIINAIRSWGVPGGSLQLVKETLAESSPPMLDVDEGDLDLSERNLKRCKRKICDGHYTAAVRVLSSSGVAPNHDATLQELKAKHPFTSAPSLPDIPIDHHLLIASQDVVLDRIKSFPRGTSCGRDGLRAQHLMDCLSEAAVAVAISDELVSFITQVVNLFLEGKCLMILGEYIASVPLTPLVKPGGGIRPIAVGTVWRRGEAILHAVNRLVEDRGDDVGLSMLLVEFCYSSPARLYYGEHSMWSCQGVQQGDPLGPPLFSLVLHPLICKIRYSFNLCLRAWYLDDGTIVGDTLVVGKVLELITKDGPRYGLHLNVDKTELFWPKEDPRSRLEGVFPPNISWPLYGVKLLSGLVSVDADFSSALVTKRVSKTIGLLDTIAKINDPQCELLLIRACAGISKLYFAMRTCPPRGFGDWQWRLATLPFAFGGLGVYSAGDVLNYAFIASRLQSAALQTKLLRHVDIVASGSTFDDALCVFNSAMEIDFLSNPSEVAAPKLMKKMADIYFTRVTKDVESSFSLSPRQMALWLSQREEHTSDWLRVVSIFGLGQTMNGKTYRCVLCYRLGVPLFAISKPCSACSKVFTGDVYGDHAVSYAGVIGIKHRHNAVRDTLVDICFRSRISAGKEVDIGLGGGCDRALRPADMLLYSWDGGLDVCADLTGSSPLTQTGMADFVPGQVVLDAAQRKRGKYMTKCAAIGYGFLPSSFSSLWELEADAEDGNYRDAIKLVIKIKEARMLLSKNQRLPIWMKKTHSVFKITNLAFLKMVYASPNGSSKRAAHLFHGVVYERLLAMYICACRGLEVESQLWKMKLVGKEPDMRFPEGSNFYFSAPHEDGDHKLIKQEENVDMVIKGERSSRSRVWSSRLVVISMNIAGNMEGNGILHGAVVVEFDGGGRH
ncbi:hypothetical protein Tco_1522262 [Tanacetum coccineum]